MEKYSLNLSLALLIALMVGCSSSQNTSEPEQSPQTETIESQGKISESEVKVDTLSVNIESNTKVAYEPAVVIPPSASAPKVVSKNIIGSYSIQIGAFRLEENSLQYAYAAKNKLDREVFNVYDKGINLFRVMVGSYETKEAAQNYLSQLVKNFPEYKDAWIIDTGKELKR